MRPVGPRSAGELAPTRMASDRLPDNQEDREALSPPPSCPRRFIAAVNKTRRDADTVIMTVKGFAGEPGVLYVALDYACHS